MNVIGLVIMLGHDGSIRCHPILHVAGDGLELAERLHKLCRALLENPDLASCFVGAHEHRAGTCAVRAGGAAS